jgi:hypothetical protein
VDRGERATATRSVEDVQPQRFRSRIGFDQVSKSPVEDNEAPRLRLVG